MYGSFFGSSTARRKSLSVTDSMPAPSGVVRRSNANCLSFAAADPRLTDGAAPTFTSSAMTYSPGSDAAAAGPVVAPAVGCVPAGAVVAPPVVAAVGVLSGSGPYRLLTQLSNRNQPKNNVSA